MEDLRLDDEIEHHWTIVFDKKGVRVDDGEKLHAKRWDVYIN